MRRPAILFCPSCWVQIRGEVKPYASGGRRHRAVLNVGSPVRSGVSTPLMLVIAAITFMVGVFVATGVSALVRGITDDSRPGITLGNVISDDLHGFANASQPNGETCGDRLGCAEGVIGDGVAIYRYHSLDLARQAVIYSEADFYRSDRFVIEFEDTLTPDERFQLLQVLEGTWTGSDD